LQAVCFLRGGFVKGGGFDEAGCGELPRGDELTGGGLGAALRTGPWVDEMVVAPRGFVGDTTEGDSVVAAAPSLRPSAEWSPLVAKAP
jgi:hypothetical protein